MASARLTLSRYIIRSAWPAQLGNRGYLGSYPHTPTQPQALQKSQPSLLISA